jgi:hypothetical protein
MVENRPLLTFLTHLILVLGVALVALPLYVAFVASTLTPEAGAGGADHAHPGRPDAGELFAGADPRLGAGVVRAGKPDDVQQPGLRTGHRRRQDRDLADLGVRDRLFPLSAAGLFLLDDLRHADAARGSADPADLQGDRRSRHDQHLRRADAAADCFGDRRHSCSASSS